MSYAILKWIHVSAVMLSFCGFAARGIAVLRGAAWVRHRIARTLPHLIDTLLLLSALAMLWSIGLSPWAAPWLRAKIIGLLLYIALGVIALHPDSPGQPPRSARGRFIAWIGALVVFGYIVSVALTKSVLGPLTLLRP